MQKVNSRTVTLTILFLLILVVVALLIGNFTFSYVGANVSDDVNTEGETTASGDTMIFSSGNNLSLNATTDNFNATSGNLTDTTNPSVRFIASSKTNEANADYYAGIRIYENTFTYSNGNTAEVILTVKDETGTIVTECADGALTYVTVTDANGTEVSGFDITGKTGAFNIVSNHPISTTSSTIGTTHTWTFTLTFINYVYDQSINENADLNIEVILQRDEITPTLAYFLINSVYTGTDGENGLYYHDGLGNYTNASEEAGDNSYRYAGANPNNYVCFGSDAASCPTDNLYRIIGIFGDQVKLVKSNSPTTIQWDSNDLTDWATSSLNINYLNGPYLNSFSNQWNQRISNADWKTGGGSGTTIGSTPVKTTYLNEVFNSSTSFQAKIGLMYISDYGYAASPENWTTSLYDYNNSTNVENNWLYIATYEWLLSPNLDYNNQIFAITNTGSINHYNSAGTGCIARATFYLNPNVSLIGGSGTQTDPYRIA